MPLRIGIIGMPNVGKSTLFNALTHSRAAQAANYPFCTIDPNVGVVEVPDSRLKKLADIVHPKKIIPATVEFVDIAGLVRGASKGEGLGNQFLAAIREVNALCHVVRFFPGSEVIHVEGSIDPKRDRETVETELALSDLSTITRRIEKTEGSARSGNKDAQHELALLQKIEQALQGGKLASTVAVPPEDLPLLHDFHLLSSKPMLYASNVAETELKDFRSEETRKLLGLSEGSEVVAISAKIEEDLQDLSTEETSSFLAELGVTSSGLDRLIASAYRILGYITFFTAGPEEVRAWTTVRGATAPEAAGVIHTDFQHGFIAAETIAYEDYVTLGGEQKAKEAGKLKVEGKNYVVKDGDVMHFRFNV
ncbi:MAG: redox-regulated ATPase YchF [Candidatus Peregrinibacteria bacterium]